MVKVLHDSTALLIIYRSYTTCQIFFGFYLRKVESTRAAAKSVVVMWINVPDPHASCSQYSLRRSAGLMRTDEFK